MSYSFEIKPELQKILKKLKKKNTLMYKRILKKIPEIIENPHHYKPLSNIMSGVRRVHFDPYVLTFLINEKEKKVEFLDFDHHDNIYKQSSLSPPSTRTPPNITVL